MWLCSLKEFNIHFYNNYLLYIKPEDINVLQFLLENGIDMHSRNNYILKHCRKWDNKAEVYQIILPYCEEKDYDLLDINILKCVSNKPKSARKL